MYKNKFILRMSFFSSLILVIMSYVPRTWAGDPLPDGWQVDHTLYPKAYGVLAAEPLMFPVDMSNWPVKIDSSHQLLVDDYLVATIENLKRQIHHPRKHPDNPVMKITHPWEGGGPVFPIVRYDEKTGRFRIWYAGRVRHTLPSGIPARYLTLYAESADGINWIKPELGLHEYEGSKANNIIIPGGNLYGLIADPNDPDVNRRYKGVVWHEPEHVPREGYFLYTSPDGIYWTRARTNPLAISLQGYTMPQTGIGDTTIFRWDRHLGKYVGDVKFVLPGKFRCRGMMESNDLIHWTRPRMMLYPDALDEPDSQVYGHLSFCYESMWIGFMRMMHTERTGWKQTTVELTASRDGRHWTRVGNREEFIPLGGPADWDADYHEPTWDPILKDEEIWIFYRSARSRDRDPNGVDAIGLAVLRRDGFVSVDAGPEPGSLVTRPLTFTGQSLFVNAEIATDGWIKVAVLSEASQPIHSYLLENAITLIDGTTRSRVTWRDAVTLTFPPEDHVRLMFQMKNAKLYSFWIE